MTIGHFQSTINLPTELPTVVTLSGATLSTTSGGSQSDSSVKIEDDGKVYRRYNAGAWVQISASTDWIIPNDVAPDLYECRFTNLTGDVAWFTTNGTEDVWIELDVTNLVCTVTDETAGGAIEQSVTFDLEIRLGGSGPALVSASYTLTANRDIL